MKTIKLFQFLLFFFSKMRIGLIIIYFCYLHEIQIYFVFNKLYFTKVFIQTRSIENMLP